MTPIFQDIIDIDRNNMKVTVKNSHGQKYIVEATDDMKYHIQHKSVVIGDYAKVIKSPVSNEWIMIDFKINTAMYEDYDGVINELEPETTLEDWL